MASLRFVDLERSFPFVGEQSNADGELEPIAFCVKKTPFQLLLEAEIPPQMLQEMSSSPAISCVLECGGEEVVKRGSELPITYTSRTLESPAPGILRWGVEMRVIALSSQHENVPFRLRFGVRLGTLGVLQASTIPFQCCSKLEQIRRIASKFSGAKTDPMSIPEGQGSHQDAVRSGKKRLRADDIVESMDQLHKRQRLMLESQMRVESMVQAVLERQSRPPSSAFGFPEYRPPEARDLDEGGDSFEAALRHFADALSMLPEAARGGMLLRAMRTLTPEQSHMLTEVFSSKPPPMKQPVKQPKLESPPSPLQLPAPDDDWYGQANHADWSDSASF